MQLTFGIAMLAIVKEERGPHRGPFLGTTGTHGSFDGFQLYFSMTILRMCVVLPEISL